jgi:Variant SH3 domain.
MTSRYVAKYPFNGNPAQAQLSFPVGAIIVARDGQEGKPWYWGNYMGRDGWFPPTYVTKMGSVAAAPVVPNAATAASSMQQRMANVSFTSSTARMQPRGAQGVQPQPQLSQTMMKSSSLSTSSSTNVNANQGSLGNVYSGIGGLPQQQQQQQQQSFSSTAGFGLNNDKPLLSGFQTGAEDPFAELDAVPAPAPLPSLTSTTSVGKGSSILDSVSSVGGGISSASTTNFSSPSLTSKPAVVEQKHPPTLVNPFKSSGMSFGSTSSGAVGLSQQSSGESASLATAVTSLSNKSMSSSPIKQPTSTSSGAGTVPQSTGFNSTAKISQVASSVTDKISSAFANVSIAATGDNKQTTEIETSLPKSTVSNSSTDGPLKQDQTQKELIEEQMARKKAEEEARIHREKELEWERNMEAEKERRLQLAASAASSDGGQVRSLASALPTPRAEGIGSSRSTLSSMRPGEVGSTGPPILHPRGKVPFFDPYGFLSDSKGEPTRKFNPIYRVQPFWALLNIDIYIRRVPPAPEALTIAAKYDSLAKALSFICHIVQENERYWGGNSGMDAPLSYLKANQLGMEACIKFIASLPHSAGASGKQLDGLFLSFINMFVSIVSKIAKDQQIVLPGGWQGLDGKGHVCLYILRYHGEEKFSFTVCNTGDGLQYHPSKLDTCSGLELKQIAMTIWDIPRDRLIDSSFWVLLFRMQVYPDKKNNAEFLYTKLLPALNSRPLWSNLDLGPSEFLPVPDKITRQNFHFLARLALTTIPAVAARPSQYSTLLLMNAAVDLAYRSIEDAPPGSMDPEDTRILKLSGRNLANFGSNIDANTVPDGTLGSALSSTWDLLDKLLQKLNYASSKPMDQHSHGMPTSALSDDFSKGSVTSLKAESGSTKHPFFWKVQTGQL